MIKLQPGGYAPNEVCRRIGLSLRQLVDYAEKRVVIPAIQNSRGQGSPRLYSAGNLTELWIAKQLVEAGLSVRNVATILDDTRVHFPRGFWLRPRVSLWLALDRGGKWRALAIKEHERHGRLRVVAPPMPDGAVAVMGFNLDEAHAAVGLT